MNEDYVPELDNDFFIGISRNDGSSRFIQTLTEVLLEQWPSGADLGVSCIGVNAKLKHIGSKEYICAISTLTKSIKMNLTV